VLTEVIRPGTHYPHTLPKVLGSSPPFFHIKLKNKANRLLAGFVHSRDSGRTTKSALEDSMLAIHVENLSDLAVVECKGRIVRSESVFKLRDVVLAQAPSRIIALDLSEVEAIGGGGLGMLVFLDRWARDHDIQLKLFSPSSSVVDGLGRIRSILSFEISALHEMMGILAHADSQYSLAA
jgi:anti-anti-sigma regulatory factor